MKRAFIATPEEIEDGKITDVYFQRTLKILEAKNVNPNVRMELCLTSSPP